MLLSDRYHITRGVDDDWFDPILDADTPLFVDPFLVFKEKSGFWADSHGRLIAHFDRCFRLIAEAGLNPYHLAYRKAVDLLAFPEPLETCIGYTQAGTRGSGSGVGFAKAVAELMAFAIRRGITHLSHFEALAIMKKDIGADRISDMTCTILKPMLIEYTHQISARHRLELKPFLLPAAALDEERQRWRNKQVDLPANDFTKRGVLLVPSRFLADLPRLNADSWWDDYENERMRTDMSYEVLGRVDKTRIVETATEHLEDVTDWLGRAEASDGKPYNLNRDQRGIYRWDPEAWAFVLANPVTLQPAQSPAEFTAVIETVITQFKIFVEDQDGWKLLWDDVSKTEKSEAAAQLLFRGIGKHYCAANGIVLDAEVDLGRGPVDFKFSSGYARRALLEVKKVDSTQFWHGLDDQLPTYLRGHEVKDGWFVAIQYGDSKAEASRLAALPGRVAAAAAKYGINLRFAIVDARPKKSASRA